MIYRHSDNASRCADFSEHLWTMRKHRLIAVVEGRYVWPHRHIDTKPQRKPEMTWWLARHIFAVGYILGVLIAAALVLVR